jgi:hypothetical protein
MVRSGATAAVADAATAQVRARRRSSPAWWTLAAAGTFAIPLMPLHGVGGHVSCVSFVRTNRCVTVVVDGVRHESFADMAQLERFVSRDQVWYLVFLRPGEAGVRYGTGASDGVLLIVTRASGH